MPKVKAAPPYDPLGRLNDIISMLEQAHADAEEIIESHIRELVAQTPGVPAGVLRTCEIEGRAGSSLNYLRTLRMLREKFRRP